MCGILGFNWQDEKLAGELSECLKHRGPDQSGFYFAENLSLAHRRLSIVDLSENGRQPMETADGKFIIVFNGEIFNFPEIREDLAAKGYVFKSTGDTEVLLYGYEEYGAGILEKLNGQFALAIFDKEKGELFLARDRAGINPLYYYNAQGKFIFGSELKVILNSGIKKEIDKDALNYYLLYGYAPREQAIIKDCFKLPAAHYLIFSLRENKIIKKERYWDFKLTGEIRDEEEAKKLILEGLDKAVKARMFADVPVGAFLSGGVDSSAVVAMMSRYTDKLNTFSVKFDHDDFDESAYAKIISDKFKTNHHVIEFTAKDVKDLLLKLPYHYDEPFGDPSMVPAFLVAKVARERVTVSLSGDGGDELFGGYDSYPVYRLVARQGYLPKIIRQIILFLIERTKKIKLKKFFRIGLNPRKYWFAAFRSLLYREESDKLIAGGLEKYYEAYINGDYLKADYLSEATNIDLRNYLVDNCLAKVDRAALANSLESRPPLLDHNFIELAARISPELKIKNGETKYIFKKALEGILPPEILYRKKMGFSMPLKYYLKNELKETVDKYVLDYHGHNLFKPEMIAEIKKIMNTEVWPRDYSRLIWALLMFNLWYERWMK